VIAGSTWRRTHVERHDAALRGVWDALQLVGRPQREHGVANRVLDDVQEFALERIDIEREERERRAASQQRKTICVH
jgi:hypothetical protein